MSSHEMQSVSHPQLQRVSQSQYFAQEISNDTKQKIESTIWGVNAAMGVNNEILDYFFRYYTQQTSALRTGLPRRSPSASVRLAQISTHGHLNRILESLKQNHLLPKRELQTLLATNDLADHDINTALDLALRVMFMISCRSSIHSITTGHKLRPAWKDTESLSALVERVLPRHEVEPLERTEGIKAHKLRARYLRDYTHISIKWTDNLPDHLYLEVTEDWKTILVFGQAGFLATALRALGEEDEELSLEESLSRGCLTPRLLSETLRTIWLLFPENDPESFKYLQQEVSKNDLDPGLLQPLEIFCSLHEHPQSLTLPEDMQDLFEQYPHWGERLYKILREVENPTPMTWYEKWSDRRASPRYTYWAAVMALAFAVFFGIAATILGALQVVMTYCTWLGDDQTDACLALKRKGKSG